MLINVTTRLSYVQLQMLLSRSERAQVARLQCYCSASHRSLALLIHGTFCFSSSKKGSEPSVFVKDRFGAGRTVGSTTTAY